MYFAYSLYFSKDMGISVLCLSLFNHWFSFPPSFFFFLSSSSSPLPSLCKTVFSCYMDMTQRGDSKPSIISNNKFLGKDSGLTWSNSLWPGGEGDEPGDQSLPPRLSDRLQEKEKYSLPVLGGNMGAGSDIVITSGIEGSTTMDVIDGWRGRGKTRVSGIQLWLANSRASTRLEDCAWDHSEPGGENSAPRLVRQGPGNLLLWQGSCWELAPNGSTQVEIYRAYGKTEQNEWTKKAEGRKILLSYLFCLC